MSSTTNDVQSANSIISKCQKGTLETRPLIIKNIGMLATPVGTTARVGAEQGKIEIRRDAAVLIEDGKISRIISTAEFEAGTYAKSDSLSSSTVSSASTSTSASISIAPSVISSEDKENSAAIIIDARGRLVTPGLVDAHTHLIFGGWRQNELGLKLHGVSYLEILAQGGGILSTVKSTRAATAEELIQKAEKALDEMLALGVTTVEAKSGYGLSTEDELKSLRVIRELNQKHPIDLVATFLGAHAVPQEYKDNREEYIRLLCEEMIPQVAAENLAEFCDVFCETGVFTAEESRRILEAGKRHGLVPKIHADEIDSIGGSQLAGEIGAISAEHLIVCPPTGTRSMAAGGTIACLLPATSFYLGATFAPARDMVNAGVPVAMASDFNPGSCPSLNLQFVMNLGCLKYKLTPEEALTAVTLNAAAAIKRSDTIGSIEPGKQADLVIWDAPDLDYIFYRMGSNLAKTVIKSGKNVSKV